MEQEAFLSALEQRLVDMEIPEEYRQQYLHQFARYFNTMSDEDSLVEQITEADPEEIALEIAEAVRKSVNRENELSRTAEESSGIPSNLTVNDPAFTDRELTDVGTDGFSDFDTAHTQTADAASDVEISYEDPLRTDDVVGAMQLTDEPEDFEKEYLYPPAHDSKPPEAQIPLYADEPMPYDAYFDEEIAPVTPLYIGVVVLTSPIALTLYATVFALFAASLVSLCALIAALSVAVIALAGGGGAVSIFDLIYGITRFDQSYAIGFYEVGLSIMLAGATLFVTILLFQFGLRFLPYLLRQLRRLLTFTLGQIRRLYRYLRKECAGN